MLLKMSLLCSVFHTAGGSVVVSVSALRTTLVPILAYSYTLKIEEVDISETKLLLSYPKKNLYSFTVVL
jgi:hypothetical protein